MAYTYDVFFSYRHQAGLREGVLNSLLPAFRDAVSLHLGRVSTFFVDVEQLDQHEPGQERIVAALGEALSSSRCMVAIWQPSYFNSIWCSNECRSFLRRSDSTRKLGQPLIFPVTIFNGDLFPPFARSAQPINLSQYPISLPRFSESLHYSRFLDEVRTAATGIAEAIRQAPEWRVEWASELWFSDEPLSPYTAP